MKIVLLVRSLGCGGAERQLTLLARELAQRHDVTVMTFYADANHFATEAMGRASIVTLRKRDRWDIFPFLTRFLRTIRNIRPDAIYAFMSVPSLVALTAPWASKGIRVVWGVRSSNVDLRRYGLVARIARWLETKLARFAHLIISNSVAGKDQALREGFTNRSIVVIGNGIDTAVFSHRAEARREVRNAFGIPLHAFIIGTVARIDPMKGYEIFLEAVSQLQRLRSDVYFVAAGDGDAAYMAELKAYAKSLKIEERMLWLGQINDVAWLYSAMDICTSASVFGEGFSNAIGEAMACGMPCVVTEVGDAALIVGDTGIIVPVNDAKKLAEGWRFFLDLSAEARATWGERARKRVVENFSVDTMVEATEKALTEIVMQCASR